MSGGRGWSMKTAFYRSGGVVAIWNPSPVEDCLFAKGKKREQHNERKRQTRKEDNVQKEYR